MDPGREVAEEGHAADQAAFTANLRKRLEASVEEEVANSTDLQPAQVPTATAADVPPSEQPGDQQEDNAGALQSASRQVVHVCFWFIRSSLTMPSSAPTRMLICISLTNTFCICGPCDVLIKSVRLQLVAHFRVATGRYRHQTSVLAHLLTLAGRSRESEHEEAAASLCCLGTGAGVGQEERKPPSVPSQRPATRSPHVRAYGSSFGRHRLWENDPSATIFAGA
jgi:hypothetical protein